MEILPIPMRQTQLQRMPGIQQMIQQEDQPFLHQPLPISLMAHIPLALTTSMIGTK